MYTMTSTYSASGKTKYYVIEGTQIKFRTKKSATKVIDLLNSGVICDRSISLVKTIRRVYRLYIDNQSYGDFSKTSYNHLQTLIKRIKENEENYEFIQTIRFVDQDRHESWEGNTRVTQNIYVQSRPFRPGIGPATSEKRQHNSTLVLLPRAKSQVHSTDLTYESRDDVSGLSEFLKRLEEADKILREREASDCEFTRGLAQVEREQLEIAIGQRSIRIDCYFINLDQQRIGEQIDREIERARQLIERTRRENEQIDREIEQIDQLIAEIDARDEEARRGEEEERRRNEEIEQLIADCLELEKQLEQEDRGIDDFTEEVDTRKEKIDHFLADDIEFKKEMQRHRDQIARFKRERQIA